MAYRHIGKANLASITSAMFDDVYIAMLKGDTLSGKPSSGSYVNQICDNITLVFEQAIKEGILVKNLCDGANPSKMDTKEKCAPNLGQAHVFIAMLDEKNDRECVYLLAVTMGLHRGEVCGLSWGGIDFERGIVDTATLSTPSATSRRPRLACVCSPYPRMWRKRSRFSRRHRRRAMLKPTRTANHTRAISSRPTSCPSYLTNAERACYPARLAAGGPRAAQSTGSRADVSTSFGIPASPYLPSPACIRRPCRACRTLQLPDHDGHLRPCE